MTEAERLAQSASITPEEWCKRIRDGYRGKPYAFKATNYYKALVELRKVGPTPPPPPPPPNDALAPYRSVLFMGQNPLDALQAPSYYKVAFTADPAYDGYATADAAAQLKANGHAVYVWYVPTEVTKDHADAVAQRLGALFVIGQCESSDQFDASIRHGRIAMVGNLSALYGSQLNQVAAGKAIVISELYRNCQPDQEPDWKNANNGVAGSCVACYGDGGCTRMPLSQYVADGMFVPHRDSLYGPGLTSDDYKTLRDIG